MKMGKWAMHDDGEEKVMEELSKGRELAMQLRRLLLNIDHDQPIIGAGAGEDDADDPVEHLAGKILDSFRNSLSILNNYSDHHHHHQVSHSIINSYSGISDHDQRTTTVPKATAAAGRRQAGGYKRRKCSELDIRKTEHSTIEYDDGHPWRKYGQKIIHNAKFPRSYYRCTHKYDQGCGARKQMEMIQQNPAKYVSRYYGHHTCTSPQKHVQFLLESSDQYYTTNYSNSTNGKKKNNVKMLSFGSDHDPCSCSPSTTTTTSTFQLPARTAAPPCTVFSPSTSTTLQVEEDHDLMKISDKLHCNSSSSSSNIVKDDDDDDEQGAAVLLTQQLHPAPAAAADHNWWCLSPEYLLPIGSSDDDDASNDDSVDFTDLQHYFTFS